MGTRETEGQQMGNLFVSIFWCDQDCSVAMCQVTQSCLHFSLDD